MHKFTTHISQAMGRYLAPDDGAAGGGAHDGAQTTGNDDAKDEVGQQQPPDGKPKRSIEEIEADLAETRREAAKYRTQARALEEAEKKRKEAELSEVERAKKEAQEAADRAARAEIQARNARAEAVAARLGAASPDDVVRLLDWDKVEDASDAKQVEAAVAKLLKDKPYLKGKAGALPASEGGNPPAGAEKAAREDLIKRYPTLRNRG